LFENIERKGKLTEEVARAYFLQVLSGIEYLHERGFVHRDIKLDNVVLDEDFNVKIIDFGLAEQC
jgi:serine/threonine protein kinase